MLLKETFVLLQYILTTLGCTVRMIISACWLLSVQWLLTCIFMLTCVVTVSVDIKAYLNPNAPEMDKVKLKNKLNLTM